MKQWWDNLQASERRTLTLGGIALAVILFYFMIWLPGHQGAAMLEQQVTEARRLKSWMQQASAEARALGAAAAPAPTPGGNGGQGLFALADQSARQAGLANAIRRVEPSGNNRVRVNLEQASFDDMIRWLATLKTRHGVEVDNITVRAANAAGRVNVQLMLEGPAQ